MERVRLKGKVALITGGSFGIGAAIASRFVAEGAKVCIVGRRQELLDKMAKLLPEGTVVKCSGDVSDAKDVERMVVTTLEFGGRLDVLVNNAGMPMEGAIVDLDPNVWRKALDVNLTGPFMLMKLSIPHMIKSGGGSIINIASVAGLRCMPLNPAYCTSKAGLIMLTQQAAIDYGPYKIRCNAVCPGWVRTPGTETGLSQLAERIGSDIDTVFTLAAKHVPLGRVGAAEEIAGTCSYLASDDSSYMTGAILVIDGGAAMVDIGNLGLVEVMREKGLQGGLTGTEKGRF
jgi:meso-butanediol dehydrogenase/(S,S)-butanediol dehydrogenase/diacetyl reductase